MFLIKRYDSNIVLFFSSGVFTRRTADKVVAKSMVHSRYTTNIKLNKWQDGNEYRVITGLK